MTPLLLLIQKFKEGTASDDEKLELLQQLPVKEEELKNWLEKDFELDLISNPTIITPEKSAEIFSRIQQNKVLAGVTTEQQQAKIRKLAPPLVKWLVAAAIIGVIALGTWYFATTNTPVQKAADGTITYQLIQVPNGSEKLLVTRLPDGSTATIDPKSAISYYVPFILKRNVSLTGKASFTVTKDSLKPFTVFTNTIATTALGTEFSVDAFTDLVQVKLISGKVVVRSVKKDIVMKDTYLNAGEQLTVNHKTGEYLVNTFSNSIPGKKESTASGKTNSTAQNNKIIYALTFNKTPLNDVFGKVGKQFNVLIDYDKKDIGNLSFTGSFLPTDSLQTILTFICSINDLSFKQEEGIIVITK